MVASRPRNGLAIRIVFNTNFMSSLLFFLSFPTTLLKINPFEFWLVEDYNKRLKSTRFGQGLTGQKLKRKKAPELPFSY